MADKSEERQTICSELNQFLKSEIVVPLLEYEDCMQKVLQMIADESLWKPYYFNKNKTVTVYKIKKQVSFMNYGVVIMNEA